MSLTWDNIDLARNEIRLETQKTGKVLFIPIAPPLREHLDSLPAGDEPGSPLHPRALKHLEEGKLQNVSNAFADLLAAAGLRQKRRRRYTGKGPEGPRKASELSYHSLRRTATTLLHEAGVPAAVAQALIGHDSEEIHQLYVSVGREALQNAVAKLPQL